MLFEIIGYYPFWFHVQISKTLSNLLDKKHRPFNLIREQY